MHFTHGNQTFDHVRRFFRIRLGGDTLIALAGSTRLICINTRNDDQTVGNILLDFCEAADIITDSVLPVCGTRSDDNEKTVIFSGDNVGDHSIPFFF